MEPAHSAIVSDPRPRPGEENCWGEIGVRGDRTCGKLAELGHCRNCSCYAAAAVRLLDRPLAESDVAAATRHFAQPKIAGQQLTHSAVVFRLERELLALSTGVVKEVAPARAIHSLPHRRQGALLGIANVRGELLVCVALGRLLGAQPAGAGVGPGRFLVVEHAGIRVALPLTEVYGLHRFHLGETKPVPSAVARAGNVHTRAMLSWKDQTAGWLDEARVFDAINRSLA